LRITELPKYLRISDTQLRGTASDLILIASLLRPLSPTYLVINALVITMALTSRNLVITIASIVSTVALVINGFVGVVTSVIIALIIKVITYRRLSIKDYGLLITSLTPLPLLHSGITSFTTYVLALQEWVISKTPTNELTSLYLVVLINFLLIWFVNTLWRIKGIGKFLAENVGALPAILFMALLIGAAALLALGDEVGANKLAELAYYSLVISVAIQIALVVSEGRAKSKATPS